jgi:plasmid maintenance system killer protein
VNGITPSSPAHKRITYLGEEPKKVIRLLPRELHEKARIKLAALDAAESLDVLRGYPGLDLKTFEGICQIRINDTYRIRFTWDGTDADDVDIGDFHS